MNRIVLTFACLTLFGCTGRIQLPNAPIINRSCENGICMPYLNLNILVIPPASTNRAYTLTLLNPYGQGNGECVTENTEQGSSILSCSYRAVRLAHPYYFIVTAFPARDATESTCLLEPGNISVQRLDITAHFSVRRVRASGICFFEVHVRDQPPLPQ